MKFHPLSIFRVASLISLVSAQSAQELIDSVLNPSPNSGTYASYSTEIYYNATLYNQTPVSSANYDRLEASARLRLPPAAYNYAAGGAGLEKTVAVNREAFDHVSFAFLSLSRPSPVPMLTCPGSGG
jgi:lactate 2-monooxygenase